MHKYTNACVFKRRLDMPETAQLHIIFDLFYNRSAIIGMESVAVITAQGNYPHYRCSAHYS